MQFMRICTISNDRPYKLRFQCTGKHPPGLPFLERKIFECNFLLTSGIRRE